jgi:hypothetical protein
MSWRRTVGALALLALGVTVFAVTRNPGSPPRTATPPVMPAVSSAPPASGTTIVGRTFTTYTVPTGTHNVIYERCTFTGGNASTAVLTLNQPCHDLTFRDCTVASGGGWNGITINASNGDIYRVGFVHCLIAGQGRMGFECTQRPVSDTVGYTQVDLTDCTFKPQAAEAISYDGGAGCRDCTIDGCVVEGAGDSRQPYGNGLEINGPTRFIVTNTTIYACRDAGLDLNCDVADCGWVFRNDVVDFSQLKQGVAVDRTAARLILAGGMNGSVWAGCKFVLGNAWNAGYWTNCSHNDLSTCTILTSPRRSMWTLDANCQGNKLPVQI